MMHAAESQAEKSFMLDGLGRFAKGLEARGIEWQAPGISTIEYLARHGILKRDRCSATVSMSTS